MRRYLRNASPEAIGNRVADAVTRGVHEAQDFAARALRITVQVVAKLVGQAGFVPLPRRWVVERTHAWIAGHRRMSRDYERLPAHCEAMIKWAMIGLMARRLAPAPGRRPWQPARAT